MSKHKQFIISCLISTVLAMLLAASLGWTQSSSKAQGHNFGIEGGHFVLDGEPFQIISGEMHYTRIPREYWRDRLKKARAMGLNTVSTYIFWNAHEPHPGVYDFSGSLDVAEFIRMAQAEGLYVILRPGPYSCAEWDLGGFPAWLLADPNIVLRSTDEKFMAPAERWIKRLGQELAPLQLARGGPILAVQVENEYGSFGNDKGYLERIRDSLRSAGFTDSLLFTADGGDEFVGGTLPDVHAAINFGAGEAKKEIPKLQKFRPSTPVFNSEYWDGWFDHWGEHHHVTDANQQAQEIDWMLSQGYSINLYMFHGGTSFGFMSGANWDHNTYEPDVTSYDYDSPVSESGVLTKKFYAFREVIAKHQPGVPLPDPPESLPVIAIADFEVEKISPLWGDCVFVLDNCSAPSSRNSANIITVERPRNMETFGESYGYIRYRTTVPSAASGDLVLPASRSYARVYVNWVLVGTLNRQKKEDRINVRVNAKDELDVIIEGTGRINFSLELRNERQGINGPVMLAGKELTGWEVLPLPMDDLSALHYGPILSRPRPANGPAFYQGHFDLHEIGDTFLDTRGWGKGVVWINGHALGRFWNIGPQQTLYVPAPYLNQGKNEVIVFTLGGKTLRLRGLREPILDELGSE